MQLHVGCLVLKFFLHQSLGCIFVIDLRWNILVMREYSIYVIDYCFIFCCRPWNWYFSGTTWSSESKADIFCREWQWFQTFSRGISLVYNKHPLLNVFPQLKQFIDQKLVLNFVVSRRAIELAFELNLTLFTIYHTTLMMLALRVWLWINL